MYVVISRITNVIDKTIQFPSLAFSGNATTNKDKLISFDEHIISILCVFDAIFKWNGFYNNQSFPKLNFSLDEKNVSYNI